MVCLRRIWGTDGSGGGQAGSLHGFSLCGHVLYCALLANEYRVLLVGMCCIVYCSAGVAAHASRRHVTAVHVLLRMQICAAGAEFVAWQEV